MSKVVTELTSVRHGQVTPSQSMDLMDSSVSHPRNDNWTTWPKVDLDQNTTTKRSDGRGRRRTSVSGTYDEPEELETTSLSRKAHACSLCRSDQKAFGTSNDLQRHLRGVHGIFKDGDRFWKCQVPGCSSNLKKWPRLDNFRQHIAKMHGNSYLEGADNMQQVYTSSDSGMNNDATNAAAELCNDRTLTHATRPRAIFSGENSRSSSPSLRARPGIVGAQPYTLSKRGTEMTGVIEQEQYESDSDASMTDDTMIRSSILTEALEVYWACPYSSVNTPSHVTATLQYDNSSSACGSYRIKSISALKQHLKRRHKKPEYYCALCYQICATSEDRDMHVREAKCGKRECPFENIMTDETWTRVNQKKGRLQDDCEEWYRIFEIIWPNVARPRSPYVESEASSWYSVMVEVFRASGSAADHLFAKLLESYDHPPPIPVSTRTIIQSAFALHQKEFKATKKALDIRPPEKRRRLEADIGVPERAEEVTTSRGAVQPGITKSSSASKQLNALDEAHTQLDFGLEPQYVHARCNSPTIARVRTGESIANGEAMRGLRLAQDDSSEPRHRKSVSLPRPSTGKQSTTGPSWRFVNLDMQTSSPKSVHRRYTAPDTKSW